MYSQDKHSRPNVVETNNTSLELSLPVNQGYVIQIKPFSEGGEGISSRQITIPKIAGGTILKRRLFLWEWMQLSWGWSRIAVHVPAHA